MQQRTVDAELVQGNMRALQALGDPYTDEEIAAAPGEVKGKTEMEALVAYLQGLGHARSGR
jgi:cytochrome c oxidase cbb3-type subunit 2